MDNNILQEANKFVKAILLGTVVESFGILNQNHFIEFRNDFDEDVLLNIDTEMQLYPELELQGITLDEYKLLVMNRLNLQRVKDVSCSLNADLNISFENGYELKIFGKPLDETTDEPWQISNKKVIGSGGGKLIIALSNNGFAMWQ